MKRHFLFYLCLLACFDASAKIVIHAGYLIDGTNDAPMNEMSIYIEQNRITQVITGYVDPEPDDEYIDLSGYTVLPGLIDMHVHLTSDQSSTNRYLESSTLNPADYAIRAVNNANKTLLAGFTTLRNLGDSDAVTISLRNAISQGIVIGPRIFSSTNGIVKANDLETDCNAPLQYSTLSCKSSPVLLLTAPYSDGMFTFWEFVICRSVFKIRFFRKNNETLVKTF